MRTCVLLCQRLACVLAVAASFGAPASSLAAPGGLWPFARAAATETVPDPLPYTATLTVTGADRQLETALKRASSLIASQKAPVAGLTGLLARARQDMATLTAVLYEHARYGAEIDVRIAGRPLASVGPFDTITARPVPVTIAISAGSIFVFGQIATSPLPKDVTLARLGLVPGKPADAATIVDAEAAIADGWRTEGHPLAAIKPRRVVADHRTNTLDVTLAVDAGPLAHFGRVTVEGTEAVDMELVRRRAGIAGGLYSSKVTRTAEKRLLDLGVFQSVRVTPAEALDRDGTIPITITVAERKPRVIGGSIKYSNTDGLGIEAHWRHRNLFGGAESLELSASVSRIVANAMDDLDFRLAGTFRKPAVLDPLTDWTLRLATYRETTDAYRVTAAEAETGLSHIFSDTLTGSLDLELSRSQTVSATETDDHLIATTTGGLDWDRRDNRLDPTEGFRAMVTAAPAYDFLKDKPFATFHADVSAYQAFGDAQRFVLAGRVTATMLTVDDIADVAADRRVYAGGAGSVRGYSYQNIAPRDGSGDIIGGRSAITLTGELRYRINDQFGVAAFVDAGNAYAAMVPDFGDLKVGIGAGIRYLTPVGPIRFDVAVPLNPGKGDPSVGLYVGLGQAF